MSSQTSSNRSFSPSTASDFEGPPTASSIDATTVPAAAVRVHDQGIFGRQNMGYPKRGAVLLPSGREQVYELSWQPCNQLLCPCLELQVRAVPVSPVVDDRELVFRVDLDRCHFKVEPGTAFGGMKKRIRQLVSAWDGEVWNSIFQSFHACREQLLATARLADHGADFPFPVEEIEEKYWAIGWNEVVPFDRSLSVETPEFLFVIDDAYGLRRGFVTDQVVLAFLSCRKVDRLDPHSKPFMGPVSVARLNLDDGTWVREEEQEGAPLDLLMAEALKIPGFKDLLRRRMQTLRTMYSRRLQAVGYKQPFRISFHCFVEGPSGPRLETYTYSLGGEPLPDSEADDLPDIMHEVAAAVNAELGRAPDGSDFDGE